MKDEAYNIDSWVQGACADMACGDEAEADKNYNDADILEGLLGDRIYDAAGWDYDIAVIIAQDLKEICRHNVIEAVCDKFIERWSRR